MSKEFELFIADKPELNLISKEELSKIRIKLGKSHRKESDWAVIKDILFSRNVLTAAPAKKTKTICSFHHVLCEYGALCVFTNIDDCEKHIQALQKENVKKLKYFEIGAIPFEEVLDAANDNGMDIYIDYQNEINHKCMIYSCREQRLKAVVVMGLQ